MPISKKKAEKEQKEREASPEEGGEPESRVAAGCLLWGPDCCPWEAGPAGSQEKPSLLPLERPVAVAPGPLPL